MTTTSKKKAIFKNNEIDVIALLSVVWDARKYVLKVTGIAIIVGLVIALISPKEYKTSFTIIPESSQSLNLGGIGGLAAQFGLGGLSMQEGENLSPDLYPVVGSSTYFVKHLMDKEFYIEKLDSTITLFQYFDEHEPFSISRIVRKYTIKLPYTILKIFRKKKALPFADEKSGEVIFLSYDEWEVYEKLNERISFNINVKLGTIDVEVKMPEPKMVADVAREVLNELTEYLIGYRIEKDLVTLEFVEKQLAEVTERFEAAQHQLAQFQDQSHGVITKTAQVQEQRLRNEYDLIYNIYSAMAQKHEEVKLKLQENTPVIKIIKPIYYPKEKSSPRRGMIVILCMILGAIVGVGIVLTKDFIKDTIAAIINGGDHSESN